jgi:hypothetical protein
LKTLAFEIPQGLNLVFGASFADIYQELDDLASQAREPGPQPSGYRFTAPCDLNAFPT